MGLKLYVCAAKLRKHCDLPAVQEAVRVRPEACTRLPSSSPPLTSLLADPAEKHDDVPLLPAPLDACSALRGSPCARVVLCVVPRGKEARHRLLLLVHPSLPVIPA